MMHTVMLDLTLAMIQVDGHSNDLLPATGVTSGGEAGAAADAAQGGAAAAPFGGDFFMIIILVMVAMLGFSFLSGRKQKKQREAMLSAVGKKDTVQTIGGIIGTVVDINAEQVVLCVHEGSNSRLTVARSAVQTVLDAQAAGDTAEDSDEA